MLQLTHEEPEIECMKKSRASHVEAVGRSDGSIRVDAALREPLELCVEKLAWELLAELAERRHVLSRHTSAHNLCEFGNRWKSNRFNVTYST